VVKLDGGKGLPGNRAGLTYSQQLKGNMKLNKLIMMGTVAGLALAIQAPLVAAENRGTLSEDDYEFVTKATQGGLTEVQLGQLAVEKATDPAIKDFGQKMVTEHGKANEELKALATSKNATPPMKFSRKEDSTIADLQKVSGAEFDRAYAKVMLKDHKKDVKEFKDAAKDLKDPELKAFAEKTLPVLEEHLKMEEQLEQNLKK
jgi:putative membrane protein